MNRTLGKSIMIIEICDKLVELAIQRGGKDNITIILLENENFKDEKL